eukprot:3977622-Prymnesium_polylepis.1
MLSLLNLHPRTPAPPPRALRARLATPSAAVRLRWSRSGRARCPPWLLRKSREVAAPSRRAGRVVALHPCDGQLPSGALLAQHHKVGPPCP